ncbi:MAG: Gldg family protein [Thermodesulfobacteriota bacterium]|nr:Gldg family protein [Thermodesulfobacteriota bacterium]
MSLKDRSGNYIKFFTYIIAIILINLAGATLFYRIDLTADRIYSISEASKKVVSTLSEPLTINIFFTKNLPAPHNNTERYLHDLLEEYAIYANQYFNYRFYNVSPDAGNTGGNTKVNQELARNYGIHPLQIQHIEKDEVKFKRAYMGLVLIHGDMVEQIPNITSIDGLEYRLTTAIQKLNNKVSALLSLPEKISIKLFFSSSLNIVAPFMHLNKLTEVPEKLEKIVKKLNEKTYGKLEFEHLDPTNDPGLEAELKKYNILSLKWPALSNGKIKAGKGSIGLVMGYQGQTIETQLLKVLRIPIIGTRYQMVDMKDMEEILDENIESLIDINQDLGFLADHGALKVSQPMPMSPMGMGGQGRDPVSVFHNLISQNYTIKAVNLKDDVIPEGLDCLVLARPTEPFTDYELFQIDQFLMRGKNLCLFLDSFKEVMSQAVNRGAPNHAPIHTGLEKLLKHYGIRVKKSYVMDKNCYKQELPQRFGGGEMPIYFAPIIKSPFIDTNLRFMRNIKGIIAMKISPLELLTEHITKLGINAHKLFSSSDQSWEMSDRINLNPMFTKPPASDDELQSFPLAYILEGEFPSFFAGKPIPEKEDTGDKSEKKEDEKTEVKEANPELGMIKGEGGFLSKGKPARIFVMASSEMIKDTMLDARGRSPNTTFIMNVIDFLNNREDIAVMRSKEQRFNPLDDTDAGIRTLVKSLNIAGLPVLVVIFGLFIWFRRHSRKRQIRVMFEK